jgi:hypothetical protein
VECKGLGFESKREMGKEREVEKKIFEKYFSYSVHEAELTGF